MVCKNLDSWEANIAKHVLFAIYSIFSSSCVIFAYICQKKTLYAKGLKNNVWYRVFIIQPTVPAARRRAPRVGNLGHITRISNKLAQLGNTDTHIKAHLQVWKVPDKLCFYTP